VKAEYDPSADRFILRTRMSEKDLVKQVPGTTWSEVDGFWRCPASWPTYVSIKGIFRHTLDPHQSFIDWAQYWWTNKYGPLTQLRFEPDAALGEGPTVQRLWPLQRTAVQAMVWAERYLELDQMGGGKTASALAALKMAAAIHGPENVFPALIVCPNKVRRSWRKIALEDLGDGQGGAYPELRMEVMPKGRPKQIKLLERFEDWLDPWLSPEEAILGDMPQVLVTNWESLRLLSRLEKFGQKELTEKEKTPGPLNAIPWKTVIADEAHRMKDRNSQVTKAMKAITFGTPSVGTAPARFRWGLTGTLISENAADAWSILNWCYPEAFPAYTRYIDRYATKLYSGFGNFVIGGLNPNTTEEFHEAVLPFTIRRLREQFDPFKPKVVRQTMTLPMEPRQKKAYDDLDKSMLAALEGGILTATDGMTKSNRLYQLASSHGEMVDKGRRDPITNEPILDLLLKAPSNKVNAMMELIEDFGIDSIPNPNQQRSIVFGAMSRQLIGLCEDALNKAKIPYTILAGGMTDSQQEMQERNFELGNTRIALCTISAAKEGLNSLINADTLVFLQKSDSRVDNEQFEARIDRPGQKAGSVTIIDMISEGTIEEFIQLERLETKYAHFQQIVADARVLQTMLSFKGQG
jgi:SNF2 family DNA or RNA helicase